MPCDRDVEFPGVTTGGTLTAPRPTPPPPGTGSPATPPRRESRWIGWGAPLGVTLLALVMRLWDLGSPRSFAFDETYYAKDAWSMLNHGYVRGYVDGADEQVLDGTTTGIWTDDPSMIVHPEVGKWLIALGEKAFGMDPFGWRVSAAVAGALMVLVMCRLARRLTGSTLLGCVAGLLLMLDGVHLVLSRLGLLDIFLALFLLCGVACVVNDRAWFRARLARATGGVPVRGGWGPVRALLWRPWLLTGGVVWGLALGTKWTAAFPLAAFGVLVWLWSAGARRSAGVRRARLRSAVVDGLPAFVHLVGVAAVVYVATWGGWLANAAEYEEALSSTQYTRFVAEGPCVDGETDNEEAETGSWPTASEPDASGPGELVQSLRSLWYYHQDVYTFHAHYLNCSTHTYASDPLGWPLLNRPVGISADTDIPPGTDGCTAPAGSDCLRQVLLIGTPVIWWGGVLALLGAVALWWGRRDWRAQLAVVGALATWLPWLQYDDRPIFFFYAVAMLPFLVLAIVLCLGRLIGPPGASARRRTVGVVVAGSFLVLVVLNAAWFWPLWTDQLLTRGEWIDRMWFARWI
ncbi:putative dolichyl-phosphate-mannose--protein mannosyltransferase [Nocardioides aquaticus]|uniref:Polyprenol-phosphate-mannose--protein mannosyltransferase n=1 Tax=Nocardioides aquaticus TaxID=160826 RepID=A0ABX8EM46_9ACTN|nr:putative dolichyl-phosphate-mannose--protein mannosyltransferase [Nocardioides aquaticus]